MGLLALLAALAAPGLSASLRASAVRSASLELLVALAQVRAAAILEGRTGGLCPVSAAGECLSTSATGTAWRSFLESDDIRDELAGHPLPRGVVLRSTRSPLRFWPQAHAASTGTLTICDSRAIAAPRAIVVSQSGRARPASAPADACQP